MGLRIMQYRAEMIGAVLTIAIKGGGTSVACVLKKKR
jgi:nitrate/nitrite-specific signal transduction histidine kinase